MIRIKKPDVFIIAVLVLGTLGLYARTANCKFINFDDGYYVVENQYVTHGFSWEGIRWAFTTNTAANWHPLTWFSLMIDGQLFHAKPGPMHLHNVLLHTLNTVLLFILLKEWTGARWVAGWAAAMFAWHPLHVESVAWVSERKDVLSTLFLLLCLLAWMRYVRKPSVRAYLLPLGFLALGLMAKPMLVTVPGILLLLDFWPRNRLHDPEVAPPALRQKHKLTSLIVEKLPMIGLIAISSVVTYIVQSQTHAVSGLHKAQQWANVAVSYPRYLWMMVVPRGLCCFYPMPYLIVGRTIHAWQVIAGVLVMLAITLLVVLVRRKFPAALFGWLWYVGTLVPVIGIISVGSQSHADRYTYTPLIGIFLAIGCIAATLSAGRMFVRIMVVVAGVGLLLGASVVTWRQIGYWKDTAAAMQRCLDVDPENYLAHRTLGLDYDIAGDVSNAIRKYNDALRYNPRDPDALRQMGRLMYEKGDNEQAKIFYRRAMFVEPFNGSVYNNYANLLMKEGRTEDAIKVYRSGIKHDPETTGNYYNLGLALAQAGEMNEAISLWQTSVRIDPDYADSHASLGAAYVMQGKTREGLSELRTALRLKPDRIDVMNQLAWTLAVHPSPLYRNAPEAEKIARQALEKSGGKDAACFDALAAALAQQGKFDQAIAIAEKGAEVADSLHTQDGNDLAAQIRKRIEMYRVHQPFTSGR